MARIFMTGFEAGSMDVLLPASRAEISDGTVRTGTYSVYIDGYNKGIYHDIPGDPSEIFLRAGVYYAGGAGGGSRKMLLFKDSAGDSQLSLYIDSATHKLRLYRGDASTLLDTSSSPLPLDVWTCLEVRIKIDNAAGVVTVKLDGVQVMDFAGDTQQTGNADLGEARWGSDSSNEWVGYLDDIAVNDTTGSKNNSWIGRGGIYGLKPNGAGTHTDFTPSAGANYECVDEVPPNDDTDYVEDDVVGQIDTYTLEDLEPVTGAVDAVQWIARAKLAAAGSGNFKRVLRHSSTDYKGDNLAVDVSYKYFTEIFDQAPDSTDWTIAKVNALEAGMEVS